MWNPLDTLRTEVLVAGRAIVGPTWGQEEGEDLIHRDPYARLYCIESGRADVTHHGRRRELRPGGYHVIPANTPVRLHCARRSVIAYLHVNATILGDMDLFKYLRCPFDLQPGNFKQIVVWMKEILAAWKGDAPGRELEVKGLLLQLLSPFLAAGNVAVQETSRAAMQRLSPVLQYIDANLHRRITLADLAGLLHLEPTYFSHQFAGVIGSPPMCYVLRRRVERGRQLLWNTDQTLETIARQLAFTDAFHFSKTFKRIAGLPPSDFRERKRRTGP